MNYIQYTISIFDNRKLNRMFRLPLCICFSVSYVQKLTPAYGITPNIVGVNPL